MKERECIESNVHKYVIICSVPLRTKCEGIQRLHVSKQWLENRKQWMKTGELQIRTPR